MWKNHKIIVLPTDKGSKLHKNNLDNYYLTSSKTVSIVSDDVNLFVLSDEEIKEGDCVIYQDKLVKNITKLEVSTIKDYVGVKKIIASTDKSLNLLSLPDDFLKEWVNNPVDEIEVEYENNYTEIVERDFHDVDIKQELVLKDNIINCRFIQIEESWDDLHTIFYNSVLENEKLNQYDDSYSIDFMNWLKENYKIPKQIKK